MLDVAPDRGRLASWTDIVVSVPRATTFRGRGRVRTRCHSGSGRDSDRDSDRIHHWRIAYGSAKEVDTHLRLLVGAGAINAS